MHHVVYPRIGEINSLIALQHDPRAILSWQAAEREGFSPGKGSSTLPRSTGPSGLEYQSGDWGNGAGHVPCKIYFRR